MTPEAVALLVATLTTCWASGYGIGKGVAWVRKIVDVA